MDTATKTGIDVRLVSKTAEATGNLFGNKLADIITSVGKTKSKKHETKKYLAPEIRQQIIDGLRLS